MAATKALCSDLCWMIGGPQGTGVDSSATLFARAAATAGYWIYGRREYHSNIKGKHSYFQIRVKPDPVLCHVDPVQLLATFEHTTAAYHAFEVVADGALIYDPNVTDIATLSDLAPGVLKFPIHFDAILEEVGKEFNKTATQINILKNAIAVAASCALAGLEFNAIEQALAGIFTDKKASLIPLNVSACRKGYDAIQKLPGFADYPYKLIEAKKPEPNTRVLINGNQSTALAKLKAGARMLTYYSITPAVDECIFLEGLPEYNTAVVQCEDELAAVNMAISAATTGIRSSTSTSGPGFCLMAEGMGFAGINEIPVVVFNYMRGGPSTGLPTRQEQGDLLFSVFTGHGDYPKILLTPGDVTEEFEDSFYCFNYADRYQTPVIVLSDRSIANNTMCVNRFNEEGLKIDRGVMVGAPDDYDPAKPETGLQIFPRFKMLPDTPISPRAVAGTPGRIHWLTGDESTEIGHITEDPKIRVPMHEKRMKKLELVTAEVPADFQYKLHGKKDAEITLVSWGSTKGAILEAIRVLEAEHKLSVNFLQIRMPHPFPVEAVSAILKNAKVLVDVENNITAQMAQLVRMRTGVDIPHFILKWSGRPMSENEMVNAVLDIHKNKTKKVVLTYGL